MSENPHSVVVIPALDAFSVNLEPRLQFRIDTNLTAATTAQVEYSQVSALPPSTPSYSLLHQSVVLFVDMELEAIEGHTEITLSCISLSSIDCFRLNSRGLDISSVKLDGVEAKFELHSWPLYTESLVGDKTIENIDAALRNGGKDLRSRFSLEMASDLQKGELFIYNPLYLPESTFKSQNDVVHTLLQIEYSIRESSGFAVVFNSDPRSLTISCMPQITKTSQLVENNIQFSCQTASFETNSLINQAGNQIKATAPTESAVRGFARYWLPCLDTLHDRATWDLTFRILSLEPDASGDKKFQNKQENLPIVEYEVICSGTRIPSESGSGVFSFHVSDPISAPLVSVAILENVSRYVATIPAETWYSEGKFRKIVLIGPRSQADLLPHAALILPALFRYYSETVGSYPFCSFGTHTIAFLKNIPRDPGPYQGGAGVTLLDSSWLCSPDAFDRTIELRRILMQSVAFQWFGFWVVPKTRLDFWCVFGLGQFMASEFFRQHFGENDHRYLLKKDSQRLAVLDTQMPPLHYWSHVSVEFLLLKSALVVYMLDKRMTKISASCGIISCMSKILPLRMLSSNGLQRCIRRESSIDGIRSFWTEWIENAGVPKIELLYSQNIGRQVIEFDMTQSNSSHWGRQAGVLPNLFSGSISILIAELDGVIYNHTLEFSRATEHFEVRFNSRYKFKKLMAKNGAENKSFEDKWVAGIKDDDNSDPYRWIQWILVDHDLEWPIVVFLRQPDAKWSLLFNFSMSVNSQFDVVSHLSQCPSQQGASILHKIAQDSKIFCRIRCDAIMGLVGTARAQFQWIGLENLVQLFEKHTIHRSAQFLDLLPNLVPFQSFQEYLIFRSTFFALCSIKDEESISPIQIKRLILRFLEAYDADIFLGINNTELLAFFIKCLCNVMLPVPLCPTPIHFQSNVIIASQACNLNQPTKQGATIAVPEVLDMGFGYLSDSDNDLMETEIIKDKVPSTSISWGKFQLEFRNDEHFLDEVMVMLDQIRIEELVTTRNAEIICRCLECLCQWMMAGLVAKCNNIFLECSDSFYPLVVRQVAFQSLILIHAYFEVPIAEYLLQVLWHDEAFTIRKSIAQYFAATAKLLGAPEKVTTPERKKILLKAYKELTINLLSTIHLILDDEFVPEEILDLLLDWVHLVLSPPVIRVRVKCSIRPPTAVEPIFKSINVMITTPGRSWQPPYTGIQPIQRLGPVGSSMLNAGNLIIESLKMHQSAPPFLLPVSPAVPGYYDIIKDPMDLQCVDRRLKNLHYQRLEDMFSDIEKIFKNFKLFNEKGTPIWNHGTSLEEYFENKVKPKARGMMPETLPMMISEDQQKKIRKIMKFLRGKIFSGPFLKPVCGVPHYYDIISNPMDLSTVRRKLEYREYPNIAEFERDIQLVLKNCFTFNAPGDAVHEYGKELEVAFAKEWKREFPSANRAGLNQKANKGFYELECYSNELTSLSGGIRQNSMDDNKFSGTPGKRIIPNPPISSTISFRELHGIIVSHEDSFDFLLPVDPVALNLPTYTSIIKKPMDLQTIGHRLHTYATERELFNDLLLMLRNSITFNNPKTPAYESSFHLYTFIKRQWQRFFGVAEFPPLLPHPSIKKPIKKPSSLKTAGIFRPPKLPKQQNIRTPQIYSSFVNNNNTTKSPSTISFSVFPSQNHKNTLEFEKTHIDPSSFMQNNMRKSSPFNDAQFYKKAAQLHQRMQGIPLTTLTEQNFESVPFRQSNSSVLRKNIISNKPITHSGTITNNDIKTTSLQISSKCDQNVDISNENCSISSDSLLSLEEISSSSYNNNKTSSSTTPGTDLRFFETKRKISSSSSSKIKCRKMTEACWEKCSKLLKKIFESKISGPFLQPVDPIRDGVPQYFEFIKTPMDFGTIRQKHETHMYESLEQFDEDAQIVFQNCYKFNGRDHLFTKQSVILKALYVSNWKSVVKAWEQDYKQELKRVSAVELPLDVLTAKKIVNRLRKSPHSKPFLKPVDPIAQFVPTYFDVIKNPMDFSTVYSKIEQLKYSNMMDFLHDMNLIFQNCFKFNNPGDPVYIEGQKCKKLLEIECRRFNLNSSEEEIINIKSNNSFYLKNNNTPLKPFITTTTTTITPPITSIIPKPSQKSEVYNNVNLKITQDNLSKVEEIERILNNNSDNESDSYCSNDFNATDNHFGEIVNILDLDEKEITSQQYEEDNGSENNFNIMKDDDDKMDVNTFLKPNMITIPNNNNYNNSYDDYESDENFDFNKKYSYDRFSEEDDINIENSTLSQCNNNTNKSEEEEENMLDDDIINVVHIDENQKDIVNNIYNNEISHSNNNNKIIELKKTIPLPPAAKKIKLNFFGLKPGK